MLIRFLIVVLAVLNLGAALWWLTPRAPAAIEAPASEPGVATLELLPPEAAPPPSPSGPVADAPVVAQRPAAETAATPAPEPAAPAAACFSLGPFNDEAQARGALETLGRELARSRLREAGTTPARSYRVLIPPAASREEAQATARRIGEAGFDDYFVMGQGEEANAVALGQYRSREGAERRQQELAAAGFPAQLVPSGGEGEVRWWLDAQAATGAKPADWPRRSGAAQQRSLDCARLR